MNENRFIKQTFIYTALGTTVFWSTSKAVVKTVFMAQVHVLELNLEADNDDDYERRKEHT